MLNEKDARNYLPLHHAIKSNDPDKFEIFAKLHKKYFSKEDIRKFLRSEDFLKLAQMSWKAIVEKYFKKFYL
jgi:hypothetical protein